MSALESTRPVYFSGVQGRICDHRMIRIYIKSRVTKHKDVNEQHPRKGIKGEAEIPNRLRKRIVYI